MKKLSMEDKELLLKDLCARLPYGVIIYRISDNTTHKFIHSDIVENIDMFSHFLEYSEIYDIKPYLRPMSSMTEEEIKTYHSYCECNDCDFNGKVLYFDTISSFDYLNSIHVDYRGLIPKNLALEAPKDIYEFNNKK